MSAAPKDRRPWPMKWIVVAIILVLVPYTFLTLRFRKEGPAFRPYEDMKNRANVARLLAAGYQRIPLAAQRPADGPRAPGGAEVASAPGGLPADLRSTLVEVPQLPAEITGVTAAPTANQLQPYAIQFTCSLPTDHQQLGGAELFIRENKLVLVPTFEHVGDGLHTRSRQAVVLLTVAPGLLKPGRYDVTLVGEKSSRTWSLEVK
jgi:hypothetical protein